MDATAETPAKVLQTEGSIEVVFFYYVNLSARFLLHEDRMKR